MNVVSKKWFEVFVLVVVFGLEVLGLGGGEVWIVELWGDLILCVWDVVWEEGCRVIVIFFYIEVDVCFLVCFWILFGRR